MGPVALALGLVLAALAAAPAAAAVARGRVAPFLVGVWVIGFGAVVAVSIALSLVSALTRPWLLAGLALLAGCSLAAGRRLGVRPPSLSRARGVVHELVSDRVLLVLALGALGLLGYSAALAFFTPPTEHDALTYHLIRAAYWKQEHGIAWIGEPVDIRANAAPIVAEVGVAAAMILDGGERFVALPQLTALVACVLGVFGLSRAVGLDRRAAVFGALCTAFLPVALVQSSTAMNDVVPAGLAVAVALFALGRSRGELVVGALALALMVGTKTASVLVLPALALIVAAAHPVGRWLRFAFVGTVACVAGMVWYAVTERHAGDPTAGALESQGSDDPFDLAAVVARFTRYLQSAIEVPGVGRDQVVYVVVGVALVGAGALLRRRHVAIAGIVVGALPALVLLRGAAEELHKRAWWSLGRHDLTRLDDGDRNGTLVQAGYSWYGPVALLLTLGALVVVVRGFRRADKPWLLLVLACSPLLTILMLAAALGWAPVYGRLVMPGVMLGAATWGVVYPIRWAVVAATASSILVGAMSFWWFDVKPVGIRLLEPAPGASGWSKSRWELQDYENGVAPFLAFVDRVVPRDAVVAVNYPGPSPYSILGPALERTVRLVDARTATIGGDWWVGPRDVSPPCPEEWAPVPGPEGEYRLLRRVADGGCAP